MVGQHIGYRDKDAP